MTENIWKYFWFCFSSLIFIFSFETGSLWVLGGLELGM